MKKLAIQYYLEGVDCARCILMAASHKHGDKITDQVIATCGGMGNGFGIGSLCGCIVACTMVLSAVFGEEEAKRRRILFLMDFDCHFRSTSCQKIAKARKDCCDVIGFVCDWLEAEGV